MSKSEQLYELLRKNRLIALLAPRDVKSCVNAYDIFSPLGIVLEIAFRTEAALEGINAVLAQHSDALVMAGTVMTAEQAEKAIEAGVAGIVSADYIPEVVEICIKNRIMCVPGGQGDAGKQLVYKSELLSCRFEEMSSTVPYQWIYKLYPAITAQTNFMGLARAWKAAFKGLQIVYSGGISLENLEQAVQTDTEGIFCGSALTKHIDQSEKLEEEAKKWIQIIQKNI